MSATAVIVSYNSAHVLPACIAALKRESVAVLVVDNASSDNSVSVALEAGAEVIQNSQNLGFGRAMNVGVQATETEFCLLINPDATVAPGTIQTLVQAAYPDAAMVAPQLIEPDGRVFFQPHSYLAGFLPNPNKTLVLPEAEACVPFVSGACMLVRRELFLKLGGFDEKIFLFYEDDDLCRRITDAGYSIVVAPQAIVHHARGKSGRDTGQYVTRYHQAWSKCYVAKKYGLPSPVMEFLIVQAGKWLVALVSCSPKKMQRHAGSIAGAWDFMRGKRK